MEEAPESSAKVNGVYLAVLASLTFINLLILLQGVPKFRQIFEDCLPGKPLPGITLMVIHDYLPLALLDFGLLLVPISCAAFRDDSTGAATTVGVVWNLLQGALVILALFMPMVGTISGMT